MSLIKDVDGVFHLKESYTGSACIRHQNVIEEMVNMLNFTQCCRWN